MNDDFKNEVFSSYNPNPVRACTHCGEKPAQIGPPMLNTQNGRTYRMFKCKCGDQTWAEAR
jgi:hypothetical protein